MQKDADPNTQRNGNEEKKTSILKIVRGNLESFDAHNSKKLSMSNLHTRTHSIRNLAHKKESKDNVTVTVTPTQDQEPISPGIMKTPFFRLKKDHDSSTAINPLVNNIADLEKVQS